MKNVIFAIATVFAVIMVAAIHTLLIAASDFDDEHGMGD